MIRLNNGETGLQEKKPPLWTKDFVMLMVISLLIFCGFQMLLPTLPTYVKTLGGDDSIVGWIVGIVTIAALLVRPFSGAILDRFGRRGVFLAGIFINILMTLAYNWFPFVGVILLIRFAHGVGWGAASTASSTIAADIIPKQRYGEGVGYYSLSTSLSFAIAPGIGITVLEAFGFTNLVFLATGFWVIALVLSFFVHYRKIEKAPRQKYKISFYEKSALRPAIVIVFIGTTYGLITSFISIYAAQRGIEDISMFFTLFAASLLISRPVLGRLVDRRGFNVIIYPGFILLAASLIMLSFAHTLPLFLVGGVLYGLGFSAIQSSLQTMAVAGAPRDKLGAANATFFTGFDGGIGIGSILAGSVAAAVGYSRMYFSFSGFVVIAAVCYFAMAKISDRRRKENAGGAGSDITGKEAEG